ncbi:MAG TPA: pitrilysin family protein [Acidimicrobiales bacterium]
MSDIQLTRLSSGLRVASERVPGARSVASGVWVSVGARDEPPELSGVSHFLEHLLFKGTETRSAKALAEAVDRVGGDMNAFTTKEYTAYYTRLPADRLELGLELLGEVLTVPSLRDHDIDSERHVILEELMMDEDSPEDRVHTLLYESLFPGHPLGRDTAGDRDTVEAITPDDVRAFFREWYHPAAMVLAVASDVEHDDVVAEAERRFGGFAPGPLPERATPGGVVRPLAVLRRPTEQAHLAVGFRAVARDDPDREALDVVNHVLGGGMSSRLFDEIREQRGLAYSVYSSPASYADAGALTVYAGTAPSTASLVLDLVDEQLTKLRTDGITDDELAVAKGYLTGSFLLGLEDTTSRMARLGGLLTTTGAIRPVDEQLARWEAVTQDDVCRVVARVLDGPRSLAALGPLTKKSLAGRAA